MQQTTYTTRNYKQIGQMSTIEKELFPLLWQLKLLENKLKEDEILTIKT